MGSRSRTIAGIVSAHGIRATFKTRLGLMTGPRRRAVIAREARLACESLGPTFIKLGQLISVRPDVFSAEMIFEMERLQDSVAAVPVDEIREVIRHDLGRGPEEMFSEFEPVPIASASIAQVHVAKLAEPYLTVDGSLLDAGTRVAVKVVCPGIEKTISADLEVARRLVRRFSRFGTIRRLSLDSLLDEFEISLRGELDLRKEGRVADRFAHDLRDDPLVVIPKVVWTRSTRRVLTMEHVTGWRLSEVSEAERSGIDAYGLALHGAEVFMRQVLVIGRYHADLHPANLFVTPDGRICYLDFGIVGTTEPSQRIAIAQVLAATVYADADRALRYSRELGLEIPVEAEVQVRRRVSALMDRTLRGPGPADVRGFAVGFLSLLADERVSIPSGFGLLIKALVTVEGVARMLYPQIDIVTAAKPYATRLIAEEMMRPQRLSERMPSALRAALRELAG